MVVVPLDRRIGHGEQLLVGLHGRQELPALRDVVAEEAAEREAVDRLVVPGGDRALLRAHAAGDALPIVDDDLLPVIRDGTRLADLGADAAVDAGIRLPLDLPAALDAKIVLFCLEAAVLAARDAELELAGKVASKVALIEHRCDLVGIDVARGADSAALAACDRAYARSAAARLDTILGEHRLRGICILDIDEGNLDGLAARQMDVAMAEGVGHLGDANELV